MTTHGIKMDEPAEAGSGTRPPIRKQYPFPSKASTVKARPSPVEVLYPLADALDVLCRRGEDLQELLLLVQALPLVALHKPGGSAHIARGALSDHAPVDDWW
jgi:hypothetical protein